LTETVNAGPKEVRKFGLLFCVVCLIAGALMAWKGRQYAWVAFGLSGVFLVLGLFLQGVLAPFYRLWMRFAALLAWLNTRVLLTVVYFVAITPVGVAMRMFGKDILKEKYDRSAQSYWVRHDTAPKDKSGYEHLF
jgi:hypothetical protein